MDTIYSRYLNLARRCQIASCCFFFEIKIVKLVLIVVLVVDVGAWGGGGGVHVIYDRNHKWGSKD